MQLINAHRRLSARPWARMNRGQLTSGFYRYLRARVGADEDLSGLDAVNAPGVHRFAVRLLRYRYGWTLFGLPWTVNSTVPAVFSLTLAMASAEHSRAGDL